MGCLRVICRIIGMFGQSFEEYVAKEREVPVEQLRPLRLPIAAADWHDCMADKSHYRWEFTTRNYKQVFDYILLHGRGIRNTILVGRIVNLKG